jgi:hypothetical protein
MEFKSEVFDDLLDNFDYYYDNVKKADFKTVESQGQKYSDMSQDVLPVLIYDALQKRIPFKTANVEAFLRAYIDRPEYRHPMWIHSDALFSDYIGIFMVQSSEFPQDDGVCVWFNKELKTHSLTLDNPDTDAGKIIDGQTMDPEKWTLIRRFEFKPNRLVVFPASYFHSKATVGNHGNSLDNCRIVHVLFFNEVQDVQS